MSHQNVEVAKRSLDAFNRRDPADLPEYTTADFAMVSPMFDVEGNSYRGREGIETYFAELHATWEEYRLIADEFRDLDDRMLALGRVEGRGRGSGVHVQMQWGVLFDLRDGKISAARPFLDHGQALRAAGLSE